MKNISTILNLFLIIILLAIFYIIKTSSGNYAVLSGSMNPAIPAGSLIVIRQNNRYQLGDIVSFRRFNQTITHRIAGISPDGKFITKGDANPLPDGDRLDKGSILGKTYMIIPYLGFLITFSMTFQGLIFFVLVPSLILIIVEIRNIFFTVNNNKNRFHSYRNWQRLIIYSLLMTFTLLFPSSSAWAYLFSIQTISGNSISMVSPEQLPQIPTNIGDILINEILVNASDGNNEWVEIYNPNSNSFDLSGSWLEDEAGTIKNLSSLGILFPGGYAVLNTGTRWMNNTGGDTVYLKNPSDFTIDSISYSVNFETDKSYGRLIDGSGSWGICNISTEGITNNGGCL